MVGPTTFRKFSEILKFCTSQVVQANSSACVLITHEFDIFFIYISSCSRWRFLTLKTKAKATASYSLSELTICSLIELLNNGFQWASANTTSVVDNVSV